MQRVGSALVADFGGLREVMTVLGYELHIEARRLSDAFAAIAARVLSGELHSERAAWASNPYGREGASTSCSPPPFTVAFAAVAWHEALDARLFHGDGSVTSDGGGVHLMNGRFVEFDPAAELHAAHAEFLDSLALLDTPIERGLAYFCSATRSQFYFGGKPGLWLLGCSCSRDTAH